jgi:glycerol-3-phosphate dehydrogenase
LDEPIATEAEIAYLLQVLNSYAGESLKKKVERTDVIASWAGLRPLVGAEAGTQSSDDSTTSSLSREHFMFEGPGRILGLIGGKLTNYRLLAIHLVDKIVQQLTHDHPVHYKLGPNQTHDMMLGGFDNKQDYLATTAQISARARRLSVEPATIDHLIATYGKDALKVLDDLEANPHLIEKICPDFPPIMAEIPFMIDEEMAISLEDILSRRVRLGFLHQRQCLDAAPKVARLVQKVANWDSARLEVELAHLQHNLGKNLIEI